MYNNKQSSLSIWFCPGFMCSAPPKPVGPVKTNLLRKKSKELRKKVTLLQQQKQLLNSSFVALLYCGLAAFRKRSL